MLLLANTLSAFAYVLKMLLNMYFWIVVIAVLISWVRPNPSNPIVASILRATYMLTEPLFVKVRKWLPITYRYGLDFSPVVVLIGIELINMIVVRSMAQYAQSMI